MKYIVIGLGNYGETLSRRLTEMGHEVIGADSDMSRVQNISNAISGAICLDARDQDAIASLPLDDTDAVIVAIGQDFSSSVQTVARLKQLGVRRIIARGLNPLHVGVLQTLGVERVTFPESLAAETLAQSLAMSEFRSSYRVDPNHYIFQVQVPMRFVGRMVSDARLGDFGLQLITIKAPVAVKNVLGQTHQEAHVIGIPTATTELREGDTLVLYGAIKDFDSFTKAIRG